MEGRQLSEEGFGIKRLVTHSFRAEQVLVFLHEIFDTGAVGVDIGAVGGPVSEARNTEAPAAQ